MNEMKNCKEMMQTFLDVFILFSTDNYMIVGDDDDGEDDDDDNDD